MSFDIKEEADHCVKCGLCLPHCPTYRHSHDEGDSPRGRISLMQGLVSGQLPISDRMEYHLDRCLACRACENVCPSQVKYGQLIDATRVLLQRQHPRRPTPLPGGLNLGELATNKPRLRIAGKLLRLYQQTGIRYLARKSRILRGLGLERLEGLIGDVPPQTAWRPYYPAVTVKKGDVALFTGCIGNIFDRNALTAAIRLLNRLGYGVHVPDKQVCCGALYQHDGQSERARELASTNLETFNPINASALVTTSSGCGAMLGDYQKLDWPASSPAGAKQFALPVVDISQFIATVLANDPQEFMPLEQRVMLHTPCSLNHVLHQAQHPASLLARIPGLVIEQIPIKTGCCGAAGTYMVNHPEVADALRENTLQSIKETRPDWLLTSNVGCALHLAAGIHQSGLSTRVTHPVVLLERQLKIS